MGILQQKDRVPEQLVYLDLAFSLFSTQAQPGASAGLSAISTVRTLPLLVRSGHTTMNGGSFPAQSVREGYHLGGVAPEVLRGGARVDQGCAVALCLILLPLWMVSTIGLVSNVCLLYTSDAADE